jgi:hypothetical protein
MRTMLAAGKSKVECLATLKDTTTTYLANIELKKMLSQPIGLTDGDVTQNRKELVKIVEEGLAGGMKAKDVVLVLEKEISFRRDKYQRRTEYNVGPSLGVRS